MRHLRPVLWIALSLLFTSCAAHARLRIDAIATLRDGLQAEAPAVRLAALRASNRIDELADARVRLLGDSDAVVRAAAARALLDSQPEARPLLHAAFESSNPAARAIAAGALGVSARPALIDPDASVREAAIVAILPAATPDDHRRIAELARTDPSGPVRARAASALDRAGLDAALVDPYLGVRLAAITALARIDSAAARPYLIRLATEADLLVALQAAVLLGDPRASIAAAAGSPFWPIRAAAANTVSRPAEAELITPLTRDPAAEVRLAAARAFIRVGRSATARPILAQILGAARLQLRIDAAAELLRVDDSRGAAVLRAALLDADRAVRVAAAAAVLTWLR